MRLPFVWLAAVLSFPAWGGTPTYSAEGIVNAGSYAAGPFAPNSLVTIFGTDLSCGTQWLVADDIRGGSLPVRMSCVQVFVQGTPVALFYVSPGQINFLMPSNQGLGESKVQVMREGNAGPKVGVTVVDAAPALFALDAEYAIATHADNSLATADHPAHAGEVIVLYAAGLGKTMPNPSPWEISRSAAPIQNLQLLQVRVGGKAVDAPLIKYAGLTPGSAGLYQINFVVPEGSGTDPEILVTIGGQSSSAGLKLAIR